MWKIKTLLLLFALALLAVAPNNARCDEKGTVGGEAVAAQKASTGDTSLNATVTAKYNIEFERPPTENAVLTPEQFQELLRKNIPMLGTDGVNLKKSDYANMPDEKLAKELGVELWRLAEIAENVKARSSTGTFNVPTGILERIEILSSQIGGIVSNAITSKVDRDLRHSVEFAALKDKINSAEFSSQETQDSLNGLRRDYYDSGFVPVTIKIGFNTVTQQTEAIYPDGRPADFQMVHVPPNTNPFINDGGDRIVSLQRGRSGKYTVMVCEKFSACPMGADGYKVVKLNAGRGGLTLDQAKGVVKEFYKVESRKAEGLVRVGAQYAPTAY